MRITFLLPFGFLATIVTAFPAMADETSELPPTLHISDMSYEDTSFAIENSIIGAGLAIEAQREVGEMLARTKETVGGTKDIYGNAVIFNFCSASVSRQVMEADPLNLQHCPYGIFIYTLPDAPDEVIVGHRTYDGNMAPVNDLLEEIVADALMLD